MQNSTDVMASAVCDECGMAQSLDSFSWHWRTGRGSVCSECTVQRRSRERDRRLAYQRVGRAVKAGRLTREPCAVCGATPTYGHHHAGYDAEHALDVTWLCVEHHREEHD